MPVSPLMATSSKNASYLTSWAKCYVHTDLGVNGRIDTIQAAVLLAKWPNFAWEVEQRSNIGASYSRKLEAAGIHTPQLGNTSVYAQYTVQVPNRARIQSSEGGWNSYGGPLSRPSAAEGPPVLWCTVPRCVRFQSR